MCSEPVYLTGGYEKKFGSVERRRKTDVNSKIKELDQLDS